MNAIHVLSAALLLGLAGCSASGSGTLAVQATDLPGNIADFSSLNVTVTAIEVTMQGGGQTSYAPSHGSFDLTKLTNGNLTTLFKDSVKVGNYSKLSLRVSDANGALKTGGRATVKAPGGALSVEHSFTVKAGKETTFVFDVVVHMEGDGSYIFQPNATGIRATVDA